MFFAFTGGHEVICGGHDHPQSFVERGAGEDLALSQVGSGIFRKATQAVGDKHHLGAIRYSPGSGGYPPVHRANVVTVSTGMPEVVLLITLILLGRDETALCFKEHPRPYQREMRYPNYGSTGEDPGRISQHRKVNKK